MFTFIELSGFSKHRESLLVDDDFKKMQEALIENPELGKIIAGTGGFRKLRWSRPGMGKSGGVRVIYYNLSGSSGRLYLALIYPKNELDNITNEQKKQLRKVSEKLI
ncbi:type II toxin-antitoxin system RelE/ParE family toxin [Vibrio sp. 1-Bac 57]